MKFASHPLLTPTAIDLQDRVRVPDGRTGEVIGFYRREAEAVIVLFPRGDSEEFPFTDLEHC